VIMQSKNNVLHFLRGTHFNIGASIGGWGVRTPQKFGQGSPRGPHPVKYPQDPLIKQFLYLYCVMDTAKNMNVWRSLAWT